MKAVILPGPIICKASEWLSSISPPHEFTGESAVGKILMRGKEAYHVIGVVDDVREESVESGSGSQIYYTATQQNPDGAQLVVRTSLLPASLATSVFMFCVH